MKRNFKSGVIIGQSLLLSLPASYALALQNPCESAANKDAIHCAYITNSTPNMTGKYIKIKEIQPGRPALSKTLCAAPSQFPLKSIPQFFWGTHQPSNQVTWQFSQCLDEDCTSSKMLLDDKFVITQKAKNYSSGPKNTVEITLDPNYGANCKAEGTINIPFDTALEMRIDDGVAMIHAVPVALTATGNVLAQMTAIANTAASGTHSPAELVDLNNQFQTLKDEMDKVQRVNTLDGYKKISAGSITISFGYGAYDYLRIPIPASDQYSLNVYGLDVLNVTDAEVAIVQLNDAATIITHALSLKK